MKKNWLAFKKKNWDSRSAQERNILKLSAWVLTPLLVYFILWQPARSGIQKLQASVPVMNIQLEKLHTDAGEVEMLRHRPKPAVQDAAGMKSTVEDYAQRHGLRENVSTLDLQQPNAVRISFASVSFELWLHWLRALQQEQHIRADSVSIATLPQPGMVKISATLVNGGAQ
jgi:type II secretory pathway component PulM